MQSNNRGAINGSRLGPTGQARRVQLEVVHSLPADSVSAILLTSSPEIDSTVQLEVVVLVQWQLEITFKFQVKVPTLHVTRSVVTISNYTHWQ